MAYYHINIFNIIYTGSHRKQSLNIFPGKPTRPTPDPLVILCCLSLPPLLSASLSLSLSLSLPLLSLSP